MKPVILLATLAALAITAAGQQAAPVQPAPQPGASFGVAGMEGSPLAARATDSLTAAILQSAACPVSMQARFNSAGEMIKVRKPGTPDPEPPRGPAQHVRVILGSREKNPIVSVRVTAYGLTARRRLDRSSDPMVKGPSDIRRTMDIAQFFSDKDGTLFTDLVLPGFTAVNTVKLESITYADGTIHEFSSRNACSVPVNPMMLVSTR